LAARSPLQVVARWRLVTVVAVLGHALPQRLIFSQQHVQLLAQLGDYGFEFGDAVLRRYASMLYTLGKSG
jgi:hypothetical protein